MDEKIKIMEFIGYQSTYAYKLYYPLDKRVHIRRYMIFNETWACKSEDILDKGSDINHFFEEHVQSEGLYEEIDTKFIKVELESVVDA